LQETGSWGERSKLKFIAMNANLPNAAFEAGIRSRSDTRTSSALGRDMPDASDTEKARLARAEDECRRQEEQINAQAWELNLLRARFARYETALSGSKVTVYTQDRDLRYTSLSNPILGRPIEDILGRTDDELFPSGSGEAIIKLKREALNGGRSTRAEVCFEDTEGGRWHDLHVEPLRNESGKIVGLTCASIDVTERKEGEAHLRLLLRELTHRSKNLLAVIQGMARQTAKHAGSIDGFLTQFSARLYALAASHDLLVRESWHGASIDQLVRSQLAQHIEKHAGRVVIEGPDVALKPEAAQNLGLALHELAINAEKFGALSVPDGRISVTWEQRETPKGVAIELDWREQLGPKVKARRKKGFGSLVIEHNLTRALDAKVDLTFEPEGLRCSVVIPPSQIVAAR
jgi:PAS domain S-box-containing protein